MNGAAIKIKTIKMPYVSLQRDEYLVLKKLMKFINSHLSNCIRVIQSVMMRWTVEG